MARERGRARKKETYRLRLCLNSRSASFEVCSLHLSKDPTKGPAFEGHYQTWFHHHCCVTVLLQANLVECRHIISNINTPVKIVLSKFEYLFLIVLLPINAGCLSI